MDLDVLIVGGGLTGNALALALHGSGLRVALAEAQPLRTAQPSFDERHLALAEASVQTLQRLGVWSRISEAVGTISRIHVSSRGEFGHVLLRADQQGVDRFGVTCPARVLGLALDAAVAALPDLVRLRPATLTGLEPAGESQQSATLQTADGTVAVRARLVVGADGSQSRVRDLAGIAVQHDDSGQVAIVSNVATERPHGGTAFERFTRDGPIAVLPLPGGRCGVVWTQQAAAAQAQQDAPDAQFLAALQDRFGYRLGRLTRLGRRASHALVRTTSARSDAFRVALIGNAAQTLHPIAAQGFNLGLRDALGLAEAIRAAADPGAQAVLADFSQRRRTDRERTRGFSEGLLALTTQPLLGPLRSLGLLALDALAPLRNRLVHFGMGYGRA